MKFWSVEGRDMRKFLAGWLAATFFRSGPEDDFRYALLGFRK
jgi:hypothetical protein